MAQRRYPPIFVDPSTNEEYRIVQQVSLRRESAVFKAVGPQGDVALKAWFPGNQHMFNYDNKAWKRFQHRGVMSIRAVFQHEEYSCQVFPWCAKQSVRDVAKTKKRGKFDELEARPILQQVAVVMAALHDEDRIHGSIQPSSILLDEDDRVLVDNFYNSKMCVGSPFVLRGGPKGNRTYLPPERLVAPHQYGKPADAWAFGTLMFEMLVGRPPQRKKKTHEVVFGRDIGGLSEQAIDLIKGLLLPNAYKRLQFEEVLQHPFITGQEVSQITETATQSQVDTAASVPTASAPTASDELTAEEMVDYLLTPSGDLTTGELIAFLITLTGDLS